MKRLWIALCLLPLSLNAQPTNEELKIGISQEFENLNPIIMSMVASNYMGALVNRQFVVMDAKGNWLPQMVKEIPTLENGKAKLVDVGGKKKITAQWEIIEAAKWGDGTPVTCEDLKFTIDAGKNQNVSVPTRDAFEQMSKVDIDAKNPKKCTITYEKARYDYFSIIPPLLPKHLEAPVLEKFGSKKEGYDQNSNYSKNPTLPGLYNGPYVVSEMKLGSHVVFTINPHFYGQKPKIKKILVKLIPNTGTMEANLRSGTIDMVSQLGLDFDQAVNLEKKVNSEKLPYTVEFEPGTTYEHIDFNLDNPILKDLKVRQALVHAINREELVQALFAGKQRAAVHNIAPLDPAFTDDPKKITLYPHSKREAARLLDEAGWKVGAGGIREKDGKKLSLVFMTTAGNKTREMVQTLLQNQWKAVGVEVVIKNEPARVYFGETLRKRRFGGMALYAWVSLPDSTPKSTLHSSQIPTAKNSFSGQNQMGWANKKVDSLSEAFELEFSPAKRRELMAGILKEYTADVPVIPLYYRSEIAVTPKTLANHKLTGHLYFNTNDVEKWEVTSTLK